MDALELLIKHTVARSTKAYFGFGPKGGFSASILGPLALFEASLRGGPPVLCDLSATDEGRRTLDYLSRLFQAQAEPVFRREAERVSPARLLTSWARLDRRQDAIVGAALFDRDLGPFADHPRDVLQSLPFRPDPLPPGSRPFRARGAMALVIPSPLPEKERIRAREAADASSNLACLAECFRDVSVLAWIRTRSGDASKP